MLRLALHWQILIAIILAVIVGISSGTETVFLGINLYDIFSFFGDIFLNALKMIIVPLVMSSIVVGVAGLGDNNNLARLGAKTLVFYLVSSFLAILVGLTLVNMIEPGVVNGEPAGKVLQLHADDGLLESVIERAESGSGSIGEVLKRMVPSNVVESAAQGSMLGLIFFSIVFGFFMTRIDKDKGAVLIGMWQGIFEVMMKMTLWVMKFAPIGIFGLVAKTMATTGFAAFGPLLVFVLVVASGLLIHLLVTMSLLLRYVGRVSPLKFLRLLSPVMLTAFSTSSSSATLPLNIETMEQEVGVSNKVSSFVLPLGATINMSGTALYECVAAIFIAQAYGLDLSYAQQFLIVVTALLTSIGVAGVPASGLVAIVIILGVIGLPLDAIALLMVVERLVDMMRTAVNVYGDSCAAVVIARTEGEQTSVGLEQAHLLGLTASADDFQQPLAKGSDSR